MNKIIILGAGMVGSAMAIDLVKNHYVTLTDLDESRLNQVRSNHQDLNTIQLDVRNESLLRKTIEPFDLVICAVPGFLGFATIRTVIDAGKNLVDISFFPENAFELDPLAREKGVTAIVDCGVQPGIGNLILGRFNEILRLTRFECLVGGLPKVRKWPFQYKAPFSPVDVIEEYTRPARYVENGTLVIREPLSDCDYVEFEGVGTLESFNSDGLRSILHTMSHIPDRKEKTLRYPGHVEFIRVLKASGFFSTEKIKVKDMEISPLDFTSKILFNEWKLGETEEEITVMRITMEGINQDGNKERIVIDLHDEYCTETQTSSMARTTGYSATAAANMFLDGLFIEKGIFPPELIGKQESIYNYIMNYLRDRKIYCHQH